MEEAKRTWKTKFCTAAESFHYAPVLVANELEMHMWGQDRVLFTRDCDGWAAFAKVLKKYIIYETWRKDSVKLF